MHESSATALRKQAESTPERVVAMVDATPVTARGLQRRVADLAARLVPLPETLGVALRNGIDAIAVELAGGLAGKTLVPMPVFFSPGQLGHILRDSGTQAVLADTHTAPALQAVGLPVLALADLPSGAAAPTGPVAGKRLVYTSGTTGQPKGARLHLAQVLESAQRLVEAVSATAEDRHFTSLPQALLLEQVCGIHAPLLAGGMVHIAPDATEQAFAGNPELLLRHLIGSRATTTVLVPQLLAGLVAGLHASGMTARDLRVVAVGGATVSPALAEAAWNLGLPVHEGYGLSECGSVVAMNRPGDRAVGTVGRPLPGVAINIEDGEIFVEGSCVMQGYRGHPDLFAPRWATGDLGAWDAEGRLIVLGRKDNVLVTPLGRNISPEWIEAALSVSPLHPVLVTQGADGDLAAIVCGPAEAASAAQQQAAQLPAFARPSAYRALPLADARQAGLFGASGKPNRGALRRWISDHESLPA